MDRIPCLGDGVVRLCTPHTCIRPPPLVPGWRWVGEGGGGGEGTDILIMEMGGLELPT